MREIVEGYGAILSLLAAWGLLWYRIGNITTKLEKGLQNVAVRFDHLERRLKDKSGEIRQNHDAIAELRQESSAAHAELRRDIRHITKTVDRLADRLDRHTEGGNHVEEKEAGDS